MFHGLLIICKIQKYMNIKYLGLLTILLGFTACDDVILDDGLSVSAVELETLDVGDVDFSNYVAVGASFTAGFTDNALFIASQENSFPNLLSKQFSKGNGGEFVQPLMSDNKGGLLLGGNLITNPRLYFNGAGPAVLDATPTTEVTNVLAGGFNNYGVPGAKSFHFVAPGYGNVAGVAGGLANPYFARMASSGTTTVLTDAVTQAPTFFTLSEIGGNDVLGYALSGGEGMDQKNNLDPATYGGSDITDPNVFATVFSSMVDALTANGAKGVVATLPSITSLPHFTTVPYNPVPLDAETAATLNGAFAAYNGGLQAAAVALDGTGLFTADEAAKRTINFVEGQNAVVIIDEYLTDLGAINVNFSALPKYRQATAEDLLVLPSSSIIGEVDLDNLALLMGGGATQAQAGQASLNGLTFPLGDKWVLTPEEQLAIEDATNAYNSTIETVADSKGLAIVDFKSILVEASTTGIVFDDFTLTTDLVFGGLVSLDGIHLTSRGYALMANKFLEKIDEKYGTNFVASGSVHMASEFPTNYSPSLQ
jgi:hypothetical protein